MPTCPGRPLCAGPCAQGSATQQPERQGSERESHTSPQLGGLEEQDVNQANRPVSSKECSWQTVTSWSTSGDCGHAVAWAALAWGWSSRAPGPGVSAPCWALGGHVGPCWIGPGLQGPTSQSKSVPPQPFMGLDFSELLTPAKHPLPRGAHGPCLSHLPDLVLLPAAPDPILALPSAAGLCGESGGGGCPAWGSMLLDRRTRSL